MIEFDPITHFISDGPFRISRNPMYPGMLLIFTGTAILFKSVTLLYSSILYIALMYLSYIRKEEADLSEQFGEEYLKYKIKYRPWI